MVIRNANPSKVYKKCAIVGWWYSQKQFSLFGQNISRNIDNSIEKYHNDIVMDEVVWMAIQLDWNKL